MKPKTKLKVLAQFLREKRLESEITQITAAQALGHSTAQYISNFERGLCEPSVKIALKLCECYGINRRELYELMIESYQVELSRKIFAPGRSKRKS